MLSTPSRSRKDSRLSSSTVSLLRLHQRDSAGEFKGRSADAWQPLRQAWDAHAFITLVTHLSDNYLTDLPPIARWKMHYSAVLRRFFLLTIYVRSVELLTLCCLCSLLFFMFCLKKRGCDGSALTLANWGLIDHSSSRDTETSSIEQIFIFRWYFGQWIDWLINSDVV